MRGYILSAAVALSGTALAERINLTSGQTFQIADTIVTCNVSGGANTTAYVTFRCDSANESLIIETTKADTGEVDTFTFDDFFRFRFECARMAAEMTRVASTVEGSRVVAACNNETYLDMYQFQIIPGQPARFISKTSFDSWAECLSEESAINARL